MKVSDFNQEFVDGLGDEDKRFVLKLWNLSPEEAEKRWRNYLLFISFLNRGLSTLQISDHLAIGASEVKEFANKLKIGDFKLDDYLDDSLSKTLWKFLNGRDEIVKHKLYEGILSFSPFGENNRFYDQPGLAARLDIINLLRRGNVKNLQSGYAVDVGKILRETGAISIDKVNELECSEEMAEKLSSIPGFEHYYFAIKLKDENFDKEDMFDVLKDYEENVQQACIKYYEETHGAKIYDDFSEEKQKEFINRLLGDDLYFRSYLSIIKGFSKENKDYYVKKAFDMSIEGLDTLLDALELNKEDYQIESLLSSDQKASFIINEIYNTKRLSGISTEFYDSLLKKKDRDIKEKEIDKVIEGLIMGFSKSTAIPDIEAIDREKFQKFMKLYNVKLSKKHVEDARMYANFGTYQIKKLQINLKTQMTEDARVSTFGVCNILNLTDILVDQNIKELTMKETIGLYLNHDSTKRKHIEGHLLEKNIKAPSVKEALTAAFMENKGTYHRVYKAINPENLGIAIEYNPAYICYAPEIRGTYDQFILDYALGFVGENTDADTLKALNEYKKGLEDKKTRESVNVGIPITKKDNNK